MKLFPDHWQTDPVSSLCTDVVDCVNKTAPTIDGPTAFKMIRTTNVKSGRINLDDCKYVDEATFAKWTRRIQPKRNDIVLTREAPLGEVGLLRSDENVFLGQRTMLYRANPKKLDQRFLYYSMLGPLVQGQIRSQGSGATVEHLRVPDAETFLVAYPLLEEQRKIAAILAAYDDLIANNQRRIALLESMAEEIYREWFVRMRFPGFGQLVRVGGVPKGWRSGTLNEIASECSKPTSPGRHLEGRKYCPLDTLASRRMIPDTHYGWEEAQSSLVTFNKDDFLFGAMRPYQHKVSLAPFDGITRTTTFVIRPKQPEYYSYLFLTLFQSSTIEYATLICNGADRPYAVWNRGFEKLPIWIPDRELASRFEKLVRPILNALMQQYFIVRMLATQRDALLPRLISGKLRVDQLDIQYPPSMVAELAQV